MNLTQETHKMTLSHHHAQSLSQFRIRPRWRLYLNQLLSREISIVTSHFKHLYQINPRPEDDGLLLNLCLSPHKSTVRALESFPELDTPGQVAPEKTAVLLNANLNYDHDIQQTLSQLHKKLPRSARVLAVIYNPYLAWAFHLAYKLGISKGRTPETFVTKHDLKNLCTLSGFELVRLRAVAFLPFRLLGLGTIINNLFGSLPFLKLFCLTNVAILRPVKASTVRPSLTVLIPARNESGNIENALKRLDPFCPNMEIIFVEGNSTDDTWEMIQKTIPRYQDKFKIKAMKQDGVGKGNAVECGFRVAEGDLLTILDADLTMPPEKLQLFYEAYVSGKADFVNGSRLLYPMEDSAMRFLNKLGNVFFAKALSSVLDHSYADSLCGTKLMTRVDYLEFMQWRKVFGKFDPFGDFDLLFPAAMLGLGTVDIPIRYLGRTYGTTNIKRFRHGLMLLKMTLVGLFKIRFRTFVPEMQKP